jgi:Mn-dependent DtxR family transcriptional regulator
MTATLTAFERRLLAAIAEHDADTIPPATLALSMNTDLGTVLETVASLQNRGYLHRQAFQHCGLTERGREAVGERSAETDRST